MSHKSVDCPRYWVHHCSEKKTTLKMSSDWQTDDDAQDVGGLSGHDIGMIGMVVGLSILWAVGGIFFNWHFDLKKAGTAALLLAGFWWLGKASERADRRDGRLKRIERKLDKVLDRLS
jgi:hypothetical protein